MFIDVPTDNCVVAEASRPPVDREVVAAFLHYPAANVGDAMDRFGLMHSSIAARTAGARCVGTALTIHTREGDNLAIHRALDDAMPGDVLVINGFGDLTRAVFGDLLAEVCLARGVAGVVIDGAARDVAAIGDLGLPLWATAVTPAGPTKTGPGRIGVPVACGGVVVEPGDVVVADTDGVAVVPQRSCRDVLDRLVQIEAMESAFRARVHASTAALR